MLKRFQILQALKFNSMGIQYSELVEHSFSATKVDNISMETTKLETSITSGAAQLRFLPV